MNLNFTRLIIVE